MLETATILKTHHLKVTPQRLAILKALRQTKKHPTAEMIYKSLLEEHPTMSLATVYKTLDSFVKKGMIQQLNVGEDSYRYDYDTSPHSHLQCTSCKKVIDLPVLNQIPSLKEEIEKLTHFSLTSQQLYFYGVCPECQKNE